MAKQKERKKVLYIITKSVWAGAGKYVYDLATGLPAESFEVFVAAGGQGELAQKLKKTNVPYFEIKNFQRDVSILKEIFAFFEILALLFRTRPDIIHVSSSKAGGVAGIALFAYKLTALRFKLLAIFAVHGWAFAEKRVPGQIRLIKFFSRLTCIFYNKIICVSEFDRQLAIKNRITRKKKLITIHNGIKIDEYKFLTKEKARNRIMNQESRIKNDDEIWIGTIGEYTKNKGQEYLIDAAKELKIKNLKFKIIIIGFGEEKKNLKSQISNLKLENNIFLIDNLPDAPKYLKAFDVFILPSLKEGFPYTLLEAGLARLPVIASNVGGIPEIINDPSNSSGQATGLLIEAGNSRQIKEAIEKITEDPNLKNTLAFELWNKVHQNFRFKQMLEKTISVYFNVH